MFLIRPARPALGGRRGREPRRAAFLAVEEALTGYCLVKTPYKGMIQGLYRDPHFGAMKLSVPRS